MRRGFKAWAENLSVQQRNILGLKSVSQLPARLLAEKLNVCILCPTDIPGITPDVVNQLLFSDPASWSAMTFSRNGSIVLIHNSTHTLRRQESDIMHELAHILCKHQPTQLLQLTTQSFTLRSFDSVQESEAAWLGGCLQIPRVALLWAIRHGMDNRAIVNYFGASNDLVRYRRQVTGIDRQLGTRAIS